MWVNVEENVQRITQGVSFGSQTLRNDGASIVCSGPSSERPLKFYKRPAPLATAGGDLEREMVSSRLLLIARRCASRCNQIPAATQMKKESDVHLFVCFSTCTRVCALTVYLLSGLGSPGFIEQESVAQRQPATTWLMG